MNNYPNKFEKLTEFPQWLNKNFVRNLLTRTHVAIAIQKARYEYINQIMEYLQKLDGINVADRGYMELYLPIPDLLTNGYVEQLAIELNEKFGTVSLVVPMTNQNNIVRQLVKPSEYNADKHGRPLQLHIDFTKMLA